MKQILAALLALVLLAGVAVATPDRVAHKLAPPVVPQLSDLNISGEEPSAITPEGPHYTSIDISGFYGGMAYGGLDQASVFSHAAQATQDGFQFDSTVDYYESLGDGTYYAAFNGGEVGAASMNPVPGDNFWSSNPGPNGEYVPIDFAGYGVVDGDYSNWDNEHWSQMWGAGGVMAQLYYSGYTVENGKQYDAEGNELTYYVAGMDETDAGPAMTSGDACDQLGLDFSDNVVAGMD